MKQLEMFPELPVLEMPILRWHDCPHCAGTGKELEAPQSPASVFLGEVVSRMAGKKKNASTAELWDFARWVLAQTFEGMDLSGGDIQDRAKELGLMREVPYDPVKHGCEYGGGWYAEPGEPWLEFAGPLHE